MTSGRGGCRSLPRSLPVARIGLPFSVDDDNAGYLAEQWAFANGAELDTLRDVRLDKRGCNENAQLSLHESCVLLGRIRPTTRVEISCVLGAMCSPAALHDKSHNVLRVRTLQRHDAQAAMKVFPPDLAVVPGIRRGLAS